MLLSLSVTVSASNFSDIKDHKLEANINRAVEIGFINGFGDGTFRPDQSLTRAQFSKMLCEMLGVSDYMDLDFKDIKYEDWHYKYVSSAVAYGFITGFGDNTFRPDQPVTRYQAAVMLERIIELKTTTGRTSYTDSASVPAWAKDGVEFAAKSGFFDGFISDTFSGDKAMSRGEAAAVLSAAHDSFAKTPVFVTTCGNLGSYISTSEYAPKGFHISGKNLFAGLGLDRLASDDVEGWLRALAPVMTLSLENPDNIAFLDEGDLHISSFTYESENTISVGMYIAPGVKLPTEFALVCDLNEGTSYDNKYELVNEGKAVYKLDTVYNYKMVGNNVSLIKTVENGKIESYVRLNSNVDNSKLALAYAFCNADLDMKDTVYISNFEIRTAANGLEYIKVTDIIDKMHKEAASKTGLPYSVMMIFAADDDAKREAYFAQTLYFRNNSTFDLTHSGKASSEAGTLAKNGAMIIGLKLLDINSLLSVNPDFSHWVSMYTVRDADGNEVKDGFTFTVHGEKISPSELFSIADLMNVNMQNLDTFAQITADANVKPGTYSLTLTLGILDAYGSDAYAEDKTIVFEVK